jgi:ATP-dependent DNA ligase
MLWPGPCQAPGWRRPAPGANRRAQRALAELLRQTCDGIALNQHFIGDSAVVLKHACSLRCEGIVSKRIGSPYRSGRADCWLKVKNPAVPAVRREAEEDWGDKRRARGR